MELKLIKFLQSGGNAFFDAFYKTISFMASYAGFLILLAFFIIFSLVSFKKEKSKKALIFSIVTGVTYLIAISINYLLKYLINRPRPYEVDSAIKNGLQTIGQSMPSGHMLSATLICGFLLVFFVFFTKFNKKSHIILFSILFGLFLIFVAISRMYLGQHYLSDLIVGFVIGVLFCFLGIFVYNIIVKRIDKGNKN